jgi:ribosomal protein S18 acetylase RimI-like enzyme
MNVTIRRATVTDTDGVMRLLRYNTGFHHLHRPDIFKAGSKKYDDAAFAALLEDEKKPVFVAVTDDGYVAGFCFCQERRDKHAVLNDFLTLYIDDICVDENYRRLGIGRRLFETARGYAEQIEAKYIDLNVWEFNADAVRFYESCGFTTRQRKMEMKL